MHEEDYLDSLTNKEIRELINQGVYTEQEVIDYFNNEWWEVVNP